MYIGMKVIRK